MITFQHPTDPNERQTVPRLFPGTIDPADYNFEGWTVVGEQDDDDPALNDHEAALVGDQFVVPLDILKQRKWNRVKQIRDEREEGVVDIPNLGEFETNEKSKVKVLGLLKASELLPTLGLTFNESYTRYDNTELAVDDTNIRQLALGVLGHVSNVFAHAKQLRVAIFAASDQAELDAIDIEGNWP